MGHFWVQGCDGSQDMDVAAGSVFAIRSFLFPYSANYLPLQGIYGGLWNPGENIAVCGHGTCKRPPNPDCGCGFWAYWHPALSDAQGGHLAGVVECYGRTLIGTKGCRAEKARILAMSLISMPYLYRINMHVWETEYQVQLKTLAEKVQKYYDVPVYLSNSQMLDDFPISKEYYREDVPAQPILTIIGSSIPIMNYSTISSTSPITNFSSFITNSSSTVNSSITFQIME